VPRDERRTNARKLHFNFPTESRYMSWVAYR